MDDHFKTIEPEYHNSYEKKFKIRVSKTLYSEDPLTLCFTVYPLEKIEIKPFDIKIKVSTSAIGTFFGSKNDPAKELLLLQDLGIRKIKYLLEKEQFLETEYLFTNSNIKIHYKDSLEEHIDREGSIQKTINILDQEIEEAKSHLTKQP